jgi:arylsulfatase A-like enzyme
MERREFLQKSGMGLIGLALSRAAEGAPHRPPSFVFILTDQQRADALGASGNKNMHTPNLDRLSREGVRFDNCYVAQAVCSPSRASIISGLYPHAHKVRDNIYGIDDVTSDSNYAIGLTWPLLLQHHGYRTCYVGKWHLGEKAPGCFDEWHGFNSNLSHWMGKPYESDYRSDVETDKGLAFIQANAKRPFVLFQSYYPPHTPYTAPKQYWPLYENTPLRPMEYYAACSDIDSNVGRLLDKLESLDLLDNTFVIFTSDHGDHFGTRPGGANKRAAYDDCARVPLIIHHPSLARGGRVRNELVSNVDLMPTILGVAGVQPPAGLHGVSLLPLLAGKNIPWRNAVTIENREDAPNSTGGSSPTCNSRGVRTREWKLILRDRLSVRATQERELYSLPTDAHEHHSIYGPQHSTDIAPILRRLEAWARSVGDRESLDLAAACRIDLGLLPTPSE